MAEQSQNQIANAAANLPPNTGSSGSGEARPTRSRKRITWGPAEALPPPAPTAVAVSQVANAAIPPAADTPLPANEETLVDQLTAATATDAEPVPAWLAAATAPTPTAAHIAAEQPTNVTAPAPPPSPPSDVRDDEAAIPSSANPPTIADGVAVTLAAAGNLPPSSNPAIPATTTAPLDRVPDASIADTQTAQAASVVEAAPITDPNATPSATFTPTTSVETQLAELARQREAVEAQRQAAEVEAARLASAEAELRRKVEQEQQRKARLDELNALRPRLEADLHEAINDEQRERQIIADLDHQITLLEQLTPTSEAELEASRLLVTVTRGSLAVASLASDGVTNTQPLNERNLRPQGDNQQGSARDSGPSVRLLRGSLIASIGGAFILAVTLIVVLLYIGVFNDREPSTGLAMMPDVATATTTPVSEDAATVPGFTPTIIPHVAAVAASATKPAPTATMPAPTATMPVPPATAIPPTATPVLPPDTPTLPPSLPSLPSPTFVPAATVQAAAPAPAASTPMLVADASDRIPTGARVDTTPTPGAEPQHRPSSEVGAIAIAQLGINSPAVRVQPVRAKDGSYYWGVDDTRIGLQTSSVGCGEAGNIVVNGHNWVTHGVFKELGQLQHDNQLASLNRTVVTCTAKDGSTSTYRVIASGLYDPDDSSFEHLLPGKQRTLTLYTCTNSGKQRIVLIAELVI